MAEPELLMHLENASAHTAWWVQQFLVAKSWLFPHLPYSDYVASCDFS
jgi:hypothetical protein